MSKQLITAAVVLSVAASVFIPKQAIDDNIKPKSPFNQEIPAKQGKIQDIMGEQGNTEFANKMNIESQQPKVASEGSSSSQETKIETPKVTDSIKVEAQEAEPVKEKAKTPVEDKPVDVPKSKLVNNDFITTAVDLGVSVKLAQAMQNAAAKYDINPRYLLAIGLSENAVRYWEIGDGGFSYGPYQIYLKVHKSTPLNPSIMDCAKDFDCSSEWTALRIKNEYSRAYGLDSWIFALSKHNGQVYCPKTKCTADEMVGPVSYQEKISKNGLLAGLTF